MKSRRLLGRLLALGGASVLLFAVACAPATPPAPTAAPAKPAAKFPSKPMLLVVPGQPGGGADVQARAVAAAVDRAKIIDEPIAVLNKGGGGAQEPFTFTASKKGDAHYMMPAAPLFLTYTLTGQAAYKIEEFTPIGNLIFDPTVIVTQPESKFNSLKDVIDAAKAKPGTLNYGGGVTGTQDHMSILAQEKAAGVKFNFVSFGGGADLHRAALGGTVDVANGNPSDFMASLEAKKLKGLAVLSDQRINVPVLKDIPTAKEQGINVSWEIFRGWVAPAGITPAEVTALEGILKKVSEDKDFQEQYIQRFGMRNGYLNSADFGKRLKDDLVRYRDLLTEAGVMKK